MPTLYRVLLITEIVSLVLVTIERVIMLCRIRKNKDVFSTSWFWKDTLWSYLFAPLRSVGILLALLGMWDDWYEGFLERYKRDGID